jgi:hypothetical protein
MMKIWFSCHDASTRGPVNARIDGRLAPTPETGRASRRAYSIPKGHTIGKCHFMRETMRANQMGSGEVVQTRGRPSRRQ